MYMYTHIHACVNVPLTYTYFSSIIKIFELQFNRHHEHNNIIIIIIIIIIHVLILFIWLFIYFINLLINLLIWLLLFLVIYIFNDAFNTFSLMYITVLWRRKKHFTDGNRSQTDHASTRWFDYWTSVNPLLIEEFWTFSITEPEI